MTKDDKILIATQAVMIVAGSALAVWGTLRARKLEKNWLDHQRARVQNLEDSTMTLFEDK